MSKYLNKKEASLFLTNEMGLQVSDKTLSKYITIGGGCQFKKFGTRVVYLKDDLISWANSKLSKPMLNSSCEVQDEK